jgi:hypothetical protein
MPSRYAVALCRRVMQSRYAVASLCVCESGTPIRPRRLSKSRAVSGRSWLLLKGLGGAALLLGGAAVLLGGAAVLLGARRHPAMAARTAGLTQQARYDPRQNQSRHSPWALGVTGTVPGAPPGPWALGHTLGKRRQPIGAQPIGA